MISTLVGLLAMVMTSQVTLTAPPPDGSHLSVRGNFIAQGLDFAGGGLQVERTLQDLWVVDGALDYVDLSAGNRGFYGHLMGRVGPLGPRGGFTLGLGPAVLRTPAFGNVFFAVPEIAHDYRWKSGVTLGFGFGLPITLNDSAKVPCEDTSAFTSCWFVVEQFHRGSVTPRFRVALGYSF